MSTSPLPPDPYEALGLSKDVDTEEVKKAHRKLVLKHHPDRIKDPALVEYHKNEFQKVQQAYEILIDPERRRRYDDEVRLAQLRKERMMSEARESRDVPRPTYTRTTYAARPSPAPTQPMPRETPIRETKPDPRYSYEDRTPDSYFDIPASGGNRMYDDPLPRGTSRKAESYDRRPAPPKATEKREKEREKPKPTTGWERVKTATQAASMFTKQANVSRDRAREAKELHAKEKELHAKTHKTREKAYRQGRDGKQAQNGFSPRVDDYLSESSDGDTVLPGKWQRSPVNQSPNPRLKRTHTPEPPKKRHVSPRPSPRTVYAEDQFDSPDEDDDDAQSEDKWEGLHNKTKNYIAAANGRPSVSRQNSEHKYWTSKEELKEHKRSGSESDKQRPTSSHKAHRRSEPVVPDGGHLRPPMPTQNSAPTNVKATARAADRDSTQRSRQNSYDSRDTKSHRREMGEKMPQLQRGASDPIPPRMNSKRGGDTAPLKSSNLKQTETNHDSGYGSGSPEMREQSPPSPPRKTRPSEPTRTSTTTYKAHRDVNAGDDVLRARKLTSDDTRKHMADRDVEGPPLSRLLSPESAEKPRGTDDRHGRGHSKERHRSRSREAEPRSRSNRPPGAERKPSISRADSTSRFEDRPRKERYSGGHSPDRGNGFSRQYDPRDIKYTKAHSTMPAKYAAYDDRGRGLFSRNR